VNVEDVLSRLERVKRSGEGWMARCPAHDDRVASLKVDVGADERVLLRCHAGCTVEAVVAALGLELRDLFPAGGRGDRLPPPEQRQHGNTSAAPSPNTSQPSGFRRIFCARWVLPRSPT
jgi:hypothetical protein